MDIQLIITILGIIGSGISGLFGWLVGRKKSNVEVDGTQIDNLAKQLNFYKKLVDDYKNQLEEYIEISEQTRLEVLRLRKTLSRIVLDVCTDNNCTKRQYLSDETIQHYLNNNDHKDISKQ